MPALAFICITVCIIFLLSFVRLIYSGNKLKFPFINDNKWNIGIFTRWRALKHDIETLKNKIPNQMNMN